MYNPPEEISVSTEIGVFYLRGWNDQLLSMPVDQGEVVLAPPPDSEELQLVVEAAGGIAVLPQ